MLLPSSTTPPLLCLVVVILCGLSVSGLPDEKGKGNSEGPSSSHSSSSKSKKEQSTSDSKSASTSTSSGSNSAEKSSSSASKSGSSSSTSSSNSKSEGTESGSKTSASSSKKSNSNQGSKSSSGSSSSKSDSDSGSKSSSGSKSASKSTPVPPPTTTTVVATTTTTTTTTTAAPPSTTTPIPPVTTPVPTTPPVLCATNSSLDPLTGCACPYGTVPADNGCCKKQCEARCLWDHPNLIRSTVNPPQMDSCGGLRICNYMWGDPHAKYRDFRYDPQWEGWMLLSQCDGLKIFSHARKANRRRVTVQSKVLVQYRTSILSIVHDYQRSPGSLRVQALDASKSGAKLTDLPLPDVKDSVTVGQDGVLLTLSRISTTKIQICTAAGDTLKIVRFRNRALQLQICLATTCNLRATGFMGIHGAERHKRFPLPNSMVSDGKLPRNGSPYFKEYLSAWYTETNNQLRGLYPAMHPAFPTNNTDVCKGYELSATPAPTLAPTERYRYFVSDYRFRKLSEADRYCAKQGGYLATITNISDAKQFQADMRGQGVGTAYIGALIGASDIDKEGFFYWKYGPPYNRGLNISIGRGRPKCLQKNCFWSSGEPNNFWGNEDEVVLLSWNRWNDIGLHRRTYRKVICEFILGGDEKQKKAQTTNPTTTAEATTSSSVAQRAVALQSQSGGRAVNGNSAAERLIADAMVSSGVDEEMAKSAAQQRDVSEGKNCTEVIAQCKAMKCPEAIFTENADSEEDQCAFAQEWIIAYEVNQELPADSPLRYDENIFTSKTLEEQENSNECEDSLTGRTSTTASVGGGRKSYYCDSCGPEKTSGCFECNPVNMTCDTSRKEILVADPVTATCSCVVQQQEEEGSVEATANSCFTDEDCQWSPLSLSLADDEEDYLHCSHEVVVASPLLSSASTASAATSTTTNAAAAAAATSIGRCVIEGGPVYLPNGTSFILLNISLVDNKNQHSNSDIQFKASEVQKTILRQIQDPTFTEKYSLSAGGGESLLLKTISLGNVVVGNVKRYSQAKIVRFTISFSFSSSSSNTSGSQSSTLLQVLLAQWLDNEWSSSSSASLFLPSGYVVLNRQYFNNTEGDFWLKSSSQRDDTSGDSNGTSSAAFSPVLVVVFAVLASATAVVVVRKQQQKNPSSSSSRRPAAVCDGGYDGGKLKTFDATLYHCEEDLNAMQDTKPADSGRQFATTDDDHHDEKERTLLGHQHLRDCCSTTTTTVSAVPTPAAPQSEPQKQQQEQQNRPLAEDLVLEERSHLRKALLTKQEDIKSDACGAEELRLEEEGHENENVIPPPPAALSRIESWEDMI